MIPTDTIPVPRELLERLKETAKKAALWCPHTEIKTTYEPFWADLLAVEALLAEANEPTTEEIINTVQLIDSVTTDRPIHRITPECQPVFPCWFMRRGVVKTWIYFNTDDRPFYIDNFTHWSPDAPTAPTTIPT